MGEVLIDNLKGVLFDLDGTLYRQHPLYLMLGAAILRAFLFHPVRTSREIRIVTHYRRAQEWLRNNPSCVNPGSQIGRAAVTIKSSKEEIEKCVAYWFDGAALRLLPYCVNRRIVKMIHRWHGLGIPMGVYSDYPARSKIAALGLDRYFSVIISSTDTEVAVFKPAVKGFHVAASKMGLLSEEIVYIGDRRDTDMLGAGNAGMRTILAGDRRSIKELDRNFKSRKRK